MNYRKLQPVTFGFAVSLLLISTLNYSIQFYENGKADFIIGCSLFLITSIILSLNRSIKNKSDYFPSVIVLLVLLSNQILFYSQIYTSLSIYIFNLMFILAGALYGLSIKDLKGYLILPFSLILCYFIPQEITVIGVVILIIIQSANRLPAVIIGLVILLVSYFLPNIKFHDSQKRYFDPVVFSQETGKQKIDITRWKNDYWFYSDGKNQFSTADFHMYYEPLAHLPLQFINRQPLKVLILGGENGLLANELLKYDDCEITIIPYDNGILDISKTNSIYTEINNNSLSYENVILKTNESDLFREVNKLNDTFDIIFADLPDPTEISTSRFYTIEFYDMIKSKLKNQGYFVTQAGNPYANSSIFLTIGNTLKESGFKVIPFHNQVPSIGEWSWYFCSLEEINEFENTLMNTNFSVSTIFLNNTSIPGILSFGKFMDSVDQINRVKSPVIIDKISESLLD